MVHQTLYGLITNSVRIYLDASIFNTDLNKNEVLKSIKNHQYHHVPSIVLRLGAASHFREVKYRPLQRQAQYAERLCALVSAHTGVVSVPAIIEEYQKYITALGTSLEFLKSHSSTRKKGSKQAALEEILRHHRRIHYLLATRSDTSVSNASIAQMMKNFKMHLSGDGRYVKRYGQVEPEVAPADAELCAEAYAHASHYFGDVAVITKDNDIVNLVRNFGRFMQNGSRPSSLRDFALRGSVRTYFPSATSWVPNFGITRTSSVSPLLEASLSLPI